MNATTDQIDAAMEAYQRKREPHGNAQNHRDALGEALRTVRPFKAMELLTAETAYGQHRSPLRWDGVPWGECGAKNHRAGIRAALNSLWDASIGSPSSMAEVIVDCQMNETHYKTLEGLFPVPRMTDEQLAVMNHALGHPKDADYRPYCLRKGCKKMPRMFRIAAGFKCWSCMNEIGFDLHRLNPENVPTLAHADEKPTDHSK